MQISTIKTAVRNRLNVAAPILTLRQEGASAMYLNECLESMELASRDCSLDQADEILSQSRGVEAVIWIGTETPSGGNPGWDRLRDFVSKQGLCVLVLTDDGQSKEDLFPPGTAVIYGKKNESKDMLRGRLATLLGIQPVLKQSSMEMRRLSLVTGPANQYMHDLDEEMRLAARLQKDFLPKSLPALPGIRFSAIYRPATFVSGDIYDVMRLDEEHVGFYVADAVGHGMPAALLTMFIKRAMVTKIIEGNAYHIVEPGAALARLNDDLAGQQLSNFQFATCCYGILNVKTLRLRVACAGHPAPMRIHRNAESGELSVNGSLLGVFEKQQYETRVFQLHAGEKLLVYSDGVEVAFVNEGPDKPLRFRQEFGNLAQYDVDSMCQKLLEIINQEEGSLHPRDDVTIVGLEIENAAGDA